MPKGMQAAFAKRQLSSLEMSDWDEDGDWEEGEDDWDEVAKAGEGKA